MRACAGCGCGDSRGAARAADHGDELAVSAAAVPEPTVDETLGARADPVRRRVVELLAQRPMRPGELAHELGASASSLSKHLRVLRLRGLVGESHPQFDARVRMYTLRSAPITQLRAWLDTAERGLGRAAGGVRRGCAVIDGRITGAGEGALHPRACGGPRLLLLVRLRCLVRVRG